VKLKKLRYIGYFFLIFALLYLVVALPTIIPHTLTATQRSDNIDANLERRNTVTVLGIFGNNYLIAGFSLFPFAGWIFDAIVMWRTGIVVASYSLPVTWLLTSTFVMIELAVYSFSILQSIRILGFYRARKTIQFWTETLRTVFLTLGVSGLVLLLSAVWEYVIITRTVLI
jgi:hypothetical protein